VDTWDTWKGFKEDPPVAFVKSILKVSDWSCWENWAFWSLVLSAPPSLYAHIQEEAVSRKFIDPPLQVLQLAPMGQSN
jgi:hypothetical protein